MSPQMVSNIKNYTTRSVFNNNTIDYLGVDNNEVATSEISAMGSGDEDIAEIVRNKYKYYN